MPQAVIPSHTTLVSNGWKWDRNSLHWSIAEPRWLDLYEDFSTLSPLADPRKQVDPIILPLRFSAVPETNNRIYIRNCYGSILARINAIRRRYESSSIVLTGQPGTGKSLWLFYALQHYLQQKEPVLFFYHSVLFLFYDGHVYKNPLDHKNTNLPSHPTKMIIALLDSDDGANPPPSVCVRRNAFTFPIYATSPEPSRYRWSHRRSTLFIGMPLWKRGEIYEGLKLQTYFGSLKTRIQGYISQQPSLEERTLSDGVFLEDEKSMDYTTLEETQLIVDMPLEAEQSGEDLSLDKEHRDALDGLTFSRDDPLHDAINRLLDWAIFHFGSVEKGSSIYDILDAIGRPASVRERYNGAVKGLTSPRILQYILQADPSSSEDPDEASHRIIALVPHLPGNFFSSDRFEVAFKSKLIHDHVIQKLKDSRYEDILQLIRFCREEGNSGPSIARVVFEKVAHRVLAGSQVSRKHVLKTYLVEQDQTLPDSPSFSMLPTSQSMFSHSIHARQIASVDFNDESAYIGFPMADTYFVPNSLSNPLLDSFCVDYSQGPDLDQVQVDVWLFQITLSSRQGLVSAGGYSHFRHILQAAISYAETWHSQESGSIRTAKKQSPELTIVTIPHCVLVCPDELKSRKWNMSPGWFQQTQKDTQFKSECFLIDLDVLNLLLSLLRFNDSNVRFRSSLVMRLENIE